MAPDMDDVSSEMDEDLAALKCAQTWTDIRFGARNAKIKVQKAPADRNLQTPYQLFKDLAVDKMFDDIITETTIYSHQKTQSYCNGSGPMKSRIV